MPSPLIITPAVSAADSLTDLAAFAVAAEAAGFDILRLEAGPGFDPLSAAAVLTPLTQRIGLCAAAHTGVGEPYTLARGFAALDHLSGGRGAWEILPGEPAALPAFVHRPTIMAIDQAERAREFVEAVCALWDSWAPDAVLNDKAEARFSDPRRIRRVDYEGRFIHTRGPLNTPRPPQGRLVLVADVSAPPGITAVADIVLAEADDSGLRLPLGQLDRLADLRQALAPNHRPADGPLRARLGLHAVETWA